jgi:multisubunit Na+/H+ antiporter MnhG subunit
MVFAWASAQVAVIGSTIMEMKDALIISCLLLVLAKPHPTMLLNRAVHATKRAPAEADALHPIATRCYYASAGPIVG